jgi:CRISPR/Cas system endoribonuclease Cas6 (RAMP superfamily)
MGKYWNEVSRVVYAAGLGGKNSVGGGSEAQMVEREAPMVN